MSPEGDEIFTGLLLSRKFLLILRCDPLSLRVEGKYFFYYCIYFDLLQRLFGVAQYFHHFRVAPLFDVCRHGSHGRELRATYYSIPFYKAVVLFLFFMVLP